MFLKDLNLNQQKLFLGLAKEMIEADSKITDDEIAAISALAGEMGQQEMIQNPSDEVIASFFPDKPSRVAVVLELIGLSGCDGEFADEESQVINRVRKLFGMTDDDIKKYKNWVAKLYAIYGEAADFFN